MVGPGVRDAFFAVADPAMGMGLLPFPSAIVHDLSLVSKFVQHFCACLLSKHLNLPLFCAIKQFLPLNFEQYVVKTPEDSPYCSGFKLVHLMCRD